MTGRFCLQVSLRVVNLWGIIIGLVTNMSHRFKTIIISGLIFVMSGCASQLSEQQYHAEAQLIEQQLQPKLQGFYQQWHGVPYRFGGQSKAGIDCSGLTQLIYQQVLQQSLPRTTAQQQDVGDEVDIDELFVGDLIFFKTGWGKRHVGVYMGDGRFLHASTSKGVIISQFNQGYWRDHFWQARRVVNGE